MVKAWKFVKKWHIIPYVIMLIVIIGVGMAVKYRKSDIVTAAYGSDAAYLYRYFTVIMAVIIIGATALFYMIFIRKAKIHNIFLTAVLSIGILVTLAVPPFVSADEDTHVGVVGYYANMISGVGNADAANNLYYSRVCDVNYEGTHDLSAGNYIRMAKDFFRRPSSTEKEYVEVQGNHISTNPVRVILYAPAVVGTLFGRLIGAGTTMVVILARLFMLAAYVALCYFAVRKIPTGKGLLIMAALLPSALMRAPFICEEPVLNGAVILFVAYAVNASFSTETLKVRDAVIMVLCGMVMCIGKGGAYIPLLLLLFMIQKKNFGGKIKYPVIVAGSIILCGIMFVLANPSMFKDVLGNNSDLYYTDEPGFSLSYILKHPKGSFIMVANTWFQEGGRLFTELFGGTAGYLQIPSSSIVTCGFVALVILAIFNVNGEELCYSRKQRTISLVGVVLSAGLALLSMWLFYTPMSYGTIIGIQGRYFFPVVLPLLLIFKNRLMIIKKNVIPILPFMVFMLYIEIFFEIWFKFMV